MLRIIFVILLFSFLTGCATAADTVAIRGETEKMDLSGGASKSEAIIIAQNEMVEKNFDKKWNISKPKIHFETEDEWGIRFYPKNSFSKTAPLLNFLVVIKKKNGEITYFGQDK